MLTWFPLSLLSQANPPDPRTFPFILLGNKIDVDGGNSRVVRIYSYSAIFVSLFLTWWSKYRLSRFLRRKQRSGVLQKATSLTSRHQRKRIIMLMLHSSVLPRLLLLVSVNRICKFILRVDNFFLD
jgi:hypothetical protein